MRLKNTSWHLFILGFAMVILHSCKKKEQIQPEKFTSTSAIESNEPETVHVDTNYQYEYRTGEAGNYEYNYDVSGTDFEGNEVSGTVFVNGKYGYGTITTLGGEELEVETQWIGKGVLKATDEEGNEYNLEVD